MLNFKRHAKTVRFDLWMDSLQMKEEWKYALVVNGELFVTALGGKLMQQ